MAGRTRVFQESSQANSDVNYFRNESDNRTIQENYEQLQKEVHDTITEYRKKKEKEISQLEKNLGFKNAQEQEKFHEKMKKQMDKKVLAEDIKARRQAAEDLARWEAELRHDLLSSSIDEIMESAQREGEEQRDLTRAEARRMRREALKQELTDSDNIEKLRDALIGKLDNGINQAISMYTEYQGKINSRLDGTQKTFKQFMDSADKMSPFYKVQDYARNLNSLVDQGIAYNVEQRAFLMTMSNKLVSTFNVNNATLLRIVRMQASDSTAIRMGMEASLNEYLNVMYRNTEYLKQTYDNVTSALLEAESTMRSAETSAEFEYVVQKWLGSLTSTGMSENTATQIAAAIGQLGSGDVSMLGTGVGNLITMAAARAGMSIGDMLTGGINANITDQLMASMVDFMQEWGATTNNVVRSQIASLFGVNVSDLMSSLNVNASNIQGNMLTSNQALGKLGSKMSSGFSLGAILSGNGYVALAEAANNIFSNAVLSMGSAIADSPLQLGIYKTAGLLADLTSGMGSLGKVVHDVAQTAKLAVAVSAGAENLYNIFSGGMSGFGFDLLGTFSRLGDTTLGANYSGASYSAKISSGGTITSTASGAVNVEDIRVSAQQDAEQEQKLARAPYEIQEYLLNTFDKKFDALVRLSAATANYSIRDQYGAVVGPNIDSLLGTSTVKIMANPADTTQIDLTRDISTNVAQIYELLQRVVSGEMSISTREANVFSQAASRYGEVRYISSVITNGVMG